jgi:protein-S-isoprenylcysteine O-methyltransferase Ste14
MKNKSAIVTLGLFTIVVLPLIVWRLLVKYPHDIMTYTGLALIIPSSILLIIAFFQIEDSLSVTPQAKELVTKGLYSKIRHPIYLFEQLLCIGFTLIVQNIIIYVFCVLLLARNIWRGRQENRILEEQFGKAYREYVRRLWF